MNEPLDLVEGDDPDCPHQMFAVWSDDDDHPAHVIFWQTSCGKIIVKGIVANPAVRGRAMLRWLASQTALPIHVVEVIPAAIGFWDSMIAEGIIVDWEPSDGFASPLERRSIPFTPAKQTA